jgi:hypothetical protein
MSLNQMLGGAPESTIGTTLGTVNTGGGGGTGAVAGSDTQVQYNSAGVAGASSGLTFNYTNGTLTTSALSVSSNAAVTGTATLGALTVTNNATVLGNLLFPTVNVFTVSGTSLTLTTASAGSYYNLINSGFSNLSLPGTLPTTAGLFWTLRNATSSYLSVTVANGYNSTPPSPLILTPSNNTTIVVSVSGTNGATISGYILF